MKKFFLMMFVICLTIFTLAGCAASPQSTEEVISEQQNRLTTEASRQLGMPNVKEFYEKKMAKEIIELRDNSKLICFAYTKNEFSGKFVYIGRTMGYGLPYSVQYTNPLQVVKGDISVQEGMTTISQADPNGLYMPEGLSATWLMIINEETGKREVMYAEPNMVVTQSKLPKRLVEAWSMPVNY